MAGWDEDRVSAEIQLRGRKTRAASVILERDDQGVRLRPDANGTGSNVRRLVIHTPRRFDVRVRSAGGGIMLQDLEGTFEGNTGGGPIVLARLHGKANLSTGGGEVHVFDSVLDGKVTTGGGPVRIERVEGKFRGTSGGGPVSFERAGIPHLESAGGDLELDSAPRGAVLSTGGGDISVGEGAGKVDASTGGGDIAIGPIAGSVHASTGAGDVHVIILKTDEPQTIDLSSGTGEVKIELPDGLDATFDSRDLVHAGLGPEVPHPERLAPRAGGDRLGLARRLTQAVRAGTRPGRQREEPGPRTNDQRRHHPRSQVGTKLAPRALTARHRRAQLLRMPGDQRVQRRPEVGRRDLLERMADVAAIERHVQIGELGPEQPATVAHR